MKRYERYKDSGIKWLGEIPEHWESTRIVNLLSLKTERGFANEELLSVYLDKGVIKNSDSDGKQVHKPSEDLNAYQLVEIGDFVMNNQQCWRGSVGVSQYRGIISPAYHIFKLSDCLLRHYANYLLRDYTMVTQYLIASKGVGSIQRILSFPWFKNSLCIIPPKSEQKQIVHFLDERLALIDKYVKDKEREVELLKELKNAEINRAVTKSLNNSEWKSYKIKRLFNERSEKDHPNEPVLCATQSSGVIPQSMYDNRVVVVNKGFENLKFVRVGDFVISLRSFQGGIEYAYYQGIISAAYTILEPVDKNNSEYFKYLLKCHSFIQLLQTCVTGIREGQNINYEVLSRKIIQIPPLSEQQAIVAYIQQMEERINKAITGIEREIELVKEYKTRLVSDVVTGKVDVRGVAVPEKK